MLFWCEPAEGKQWFLTVVDPALHVRRVFGKQTTIVLS
jgi:hypothetical protein